MSRTGRHADRAGGSRKQKLGVFDDEPMGFLGRKARLQQIAQLPQERGLAAKFFHFLMQPLVFPHLVGELNRAANGKDRHSNGQHERCHDDFIYFRVLVQCDPLCERARVEEPHENSGDEQHAEQNEQITLHGNATSREPGIYFAPVYVHSSANHTSGEPPIRSNRGKPYSFMLPKHANGNCAFFWTCREDNTHTFAL